MRASLLQKPTMANKQMDSLFQVSKCELSGFEDKNIDIIWPGP